MKRRTFLSTGLAATARPGVAAGSRPDFRYAPRVQQAAFCFPDDPHKSLVGERGDLRYGYDRRRRVFHFPMVVQFGLAGDMREPTVVQRLDAPEVPVVHTRLEYAEAWLELTTFATDRTGEGRVDNVVLEVRPKSRRPVFAAPVIALKTRRAATVKDGRTVLVDDRAFLISSHPLRGSDTGDGYRYTLPEAGTPLRCFFRFPQQGQTVETGDPDALLAEARAWWRNWRPFQGEVAWKLPGVYNDFLLACTRNILQARERVEGKLTFQVGPTTYRGLWVVDGHFILEAARYLGYDQEVQQGLETTWAMQRADGGIFAGGGTEHWKDTGIAMFSMVRQAQLGQDWNWFRRMQPQVLAGVRFLDGLRERARTEGGANGRYGLLARGMGDGGVGGVRDELTNTLWALAGLEAMAAAGGPPEARQLAASLRKALDACIPQQMRKHHAGFQYLHMVLKEDPQWNDPDERKRWRPQSGQWALAQSIYPGLLFSRDDPVVRGYLALMKASTQEDVPVETGWLPHEGVWNYDAAFCAHAALWAGERDYALDTFTGFLNHATPLYCWREEQPLQNSLIGSYVGDMPHNWASAECVLFLRHMLALEDGAALRLLAGIGAEQLAWREPYEIAASPTRFGRVGLRLEPAAGGWRLAFRRAAGPAPRTVELPEDLGGPRFSAARGAKYETARGVVRMDPAATEWEATWR